MDVLVRVKDGHESIDGDDEHMPDGEECQDVHTRPEQFNLPIVNRMSHYVL